MRTYEKTHPWLVFQIDTSKFPYNLWIGLGEAQSKCEHIAGVPLAPEIADDLYNIYLAKGALATAAIEGNTLSEEEALDRVEGKKNLPPSKEYLGQELDNIIDACNLIAKRLFQDGDNHIDVKRIKEFNFKVLENLPVAEEVCPGQIRQHDVGVGRYKAVPYQDCEYLLGKYCEWLNNFGCPDENKKIVFGIIKAIASHIFFALLHPFADGNGRTARLIELKILLSAGVPMPAAQLLNNHYNQTRNEYYRQLDMISKKDGSIVDFFEYAIQGYIDGLREQLKTILGYQFNVAWINYVHELFKNRETPASVRRRNLALDLASYKEKIQISKIRELSPRIAEAYAGKNLKTIVRDLITLSSMDLVVRSKDGVRAKTEIIKAFLPQRWNED